jgi:hypothetical protein
LVSIPSTSHVLVNVFFSKSEEFFIFYSRNWKKIEYIFIKIEKKNDNFENELLCNSLPFPNKEFWNEGNSNVSSKQKILKW